MTSYRLKFFRKSAYLFGAIIICSASIGSTVSLASTSSNPKLSDQANMTNHRSDLEITRSIRQSLVKDPHLSLDAHNIKIITQNGKVILKGPVRSDEEKAIVAEKAKTIAGSKNVEDQLQVTNRS